jgi:hypothetical protein
VNLLTKWGSHIGQRPTIPKLFLKPDFLPQIAMALEICQPKRSIQKQCTITENFCCNRLIVNALRQFRADNVLEQMFDAEPD